MLDQVFILEKPYSVVDLNPFIEEQWVETPQQYERFVASHPSFLMANVPVRSDKSQYLV